MKTKPITRREFLRSAAFTAAATALGALAGGIVKAEARVPAEDIQAVPLGVEDTPAQPGLDIRWADLLGERTFWGMPTCDNPVTITFTWDEPY